ncbi:MAG: discoidin domain-containing protein [Bacteroidaceae bacterium]|nr:discoidin domain-containing protein [Bacteroidaceae bacterium]
MKKLYLFLFAIAAFAMQANASVKLTALSGNNWDHDSESPKALLDEQTNSKWGTWDGYYGQPVYIIMEASAPIAPKSYELISANDTNGDTGRSWSQWKIYGGNFASAAEATIDAAGWTLIDNKQNQTLDKGQFAVNKLNISESIADGTYYSYFKIVVEGLEGGWEKYCQMDGFRFTNVKFAPQDVTFTCTAGKNYGQNEGIQRMFDLDCNTKYCGDAGSECYALVTASEPVFVWGYDMTTANDNDNGRKVSKWSVYGTNDETVAANANSDGWVTLSDIDGSDPQYIEGKNWYTQRFFCNKSTVGTAYKYFKVTLNDGGFIQLSEFRFCYDTHRVVTYNWTSGPEAAKKAFDGLPNPKWEGWPSDITGSSHAITIETSDGESYAIKKYHFTTNDDGSWQNRAPKSWTIEGSDDNSNWTKIADVDDKYAIHNANFTTYEFTPDNTTDAFRYVRLTLNEMKSTGWSQIGDFQVLAVSDVSDRDYYTAQVNAAKAASYDRGSLSETDPWYVEYKTLYDGLDAALAAAISSGNYNQIPVMINKMNHLVELMDVLKAKTNDYVAFDGTSTWGDGPWTNLVDGKDGIDGRESTKWGGNFSGNVGDPGHVQYVIFRTKEAMQPYFYRLVTGGDTHTQTGRNWKSWKVYGANFSSVSEATYANVANWTVLDERNNISAEYLPMEDCYPAAFNFTEGVSEPYIYYMIAVTESNSTQQQMNEMYLCLQSEFEAMRAPLVAYFDDFDKTRPVEADYEDELAEFNTKFAQLQTTDDAVQLTLLYNQCVALRAALEGSMAAMDLTNNVNAVNGVYQLGNATQLNYFSKAINAGRNELDAVLTANIDMTGVTMAPIGTQDNPYKGTFDGQGKTISNFTFSNTNTDNVGLFGVVNAAIIQKVILENANVVGNANAGGLVGNAQNASTIQNCAVIGSSIEGRDHVAAIAANAVGGTVISNNYSNAEVKSRQYQAGGMVGTIRSVTVEKNLFTGTVTCQNGGDASGLVSRIDAESDPEPVIQNNMVAAPTISGGNTYAIMRADGFLEGERPVTFANNYTLLSTVYSTGAKELTDKDDKNGKQIDWVEATTKSFYETTLGWDFTDDWKFTCGGKYPILKIMADEALPTQGLDVSSVGYATIVANYDYDFTGASFEAFAVTESETENVVHLEPVTSAKHGEALLLKKENGGNFTQTATATAQTASTENLLKASDGTIIGGEGIYALAKKNDKVGFYPVAATVTIPAGKAYLKIETEVGGEVKGFYGFEEDDATGISNLNVDLNANEAIYNLAGQRLQKMQKGINIINGKKVLY